MMRLVPTAGATYQLANSTANHTVNVTFGTVTNMGAALYETNAQGANDGCANSTAIISALTPNYSSPSYNGSSPVPLSDYAVYGIIDFCQFLDKIPNNF